MRLGVNLGYASPGTNPTELIDFAVEAEALGYDSAWAAEAWGTDVVTVLSWLGAKTQSLKLGAGIMQIPARSAGMTAMTAATLDLMSGGRFLLGLGLSGPQVAEGYAGRAQARRATGDRAGAAADAKKALELGVREEMRPQVEKILRGE